MKKYSDGKREIYATEKAYVTIYKRQGFKEIKEENKKLTKKKVGDK